MKGIRFYEELTDKGRKAEKSQGTVVAILTDSGWPDLNGYNDPIMAYDAVGGVYPVPNSPVASTRTDTGYLYESCRRVSEAKARSLHPALFQYLDYEPEG